MLFLLLLLLIFGCHCHNRKLSPLLSSISWILSKGNKWNLNNNENYWSHIQRDIYFIGKKKRTEIFKHTKNQFQIVLFCFFFFILLKFDFFLFFEIKINCWFGDKKKMREKPTVTHICFCFCFIENLLLNAILLYALLNTYTKSTQTHTIKYTHKQLSKRATICFYFSSLFFFF